MQQCAMLWPNARQGCEITIPRINLPGPGAIVQRKAGALMMFTYYVYGWLLTLRSTWGGGSSTGKATAL